MPPNSEKRPPPTVKQTVESRFGQVAANYASSIVHQQGEEFSVMLELAELSGTEQVLDAGCGAGHTALTFAPHVRHITAVDLTEAMLEHGRRLAAEKNLGNVTFKLGDVEQLPFEDNTFDLVVTRYSAHHWPNPDQALTEFYRVLRKNNAKNAQLLIADVVSYNDYTADSHLQTIEILRDSSHVRDHTPDQWLAMLDNAGFEAKLSYEWLLWIDFDSWVERMRTPADNAAIIRKLLQEAPDIVREKLRVESNGDFSFRSALFSATTQHQ